MPRHCSSSSGSRVPATAEHLVAAARRERDDSWNVIGRLGTTEFFIEERGDAPGIAALEQLHQRGAPGAYPVLREDSGIVLGGALAARCAGAGVQREFRARCRAARPVVMTLMIGVAVLVLPQGVDGDGPDLSNLVRPVASGRTSAESEVVQESNGESPMNVTEAKALFAKHQIKYVLAQFVDIHGVAKTKAVPVEHLDMVLTDGAGFAGFALWGFGMEPHGPDYMAVGDLSTLTPVPWQPGYARIVCNGTVKGKPGPTARA